MSAATEKLSGLARSAAIIFSGNVLGRVFNLLGQVLIIRSLTPTSFGYVALAYTVASAIGALAIFGVKDGVTRLMSAGAEEEGVEIVRAGVLITVITGAVGAALMYLARTRIADVMSESALTPLLVLFAALVLFKPLAETLFGVLRAFGSSRAAILTRNIVPRVVGLVVFGIGVLLIDEVSAAVMYWVSIPVIMIVVSSYFILKRLGTKNVFSGGVKASRIRDLLVFSGPLAVGSVVFLFLGQLDVLMLGYFADSKAVGLYRSILPLQQSSTFIMTSFTFLFLPLATEFFEERQFDDLSELYTVSTKWISALTLPMVLVLGLFPSPVINAFFGSSYLPAAPALTILILGMYSRALVGLNGDMVRAINRPEIELYTAVGGLAVNAVLNVLLIPQYGIVGAAVATVSGYTVYNVGEVAAVYYYTKTHPFSWRLFRQLIPTTAVALACWWFLGPLALHWLFVLGFFLAVVQIASTILTRSVDEADILLVDQFEDAVGRDFPKIRRLITTYGQ